MKHFTDEAWFDYSRRLLPAEEMSAMQAHLDGGCEACAELHATWAVVYATTSRQSEYEPRESILHYVKTAFLARVWEPAVPAVEAVMARVLFDSFQPGAAMAGVRSGSAGSRHLLCESGTKTIEVEVDSDTSGLRITGQILETDVSVTGVHPVEVGLVHNGIVISQMVASEFGEFRFNCNQTADIRLRFKVREAELVDVLLTA